MDVLTLLGKYQKSHKWREALSTLESSLQQGLVPPVQGFNMVISACAKKQEMDEAIRVFDSMQAYGVQPDIFTYTILMRNLTPGPAAPKQARILYDEMLAANVRGDQALFNSVMEVLIQSRDFASAADAFANGRSAGIGGWLIPEGLDTVKQNAFCIALPITHAELSKDPKQSQK